MPCRRAARRQPGSHALSLRGGDVGLDLLPVWEGGEWAHPDAGGVGHADAQRFRVVLETGEHRVEGRALHEEPRSRHAGLPTALEDAADDASTAASRSASAKTMLGDFPPSSRATGIRRSAAIVPMARPVSVPPVKDTIRTPGCRTSGRPCRDRCR